MATKKQQDPVVSGYEALANNLLDNPASYTGLYYTPTTGRGGRNTSNLDYMYQSIREQQAAETLRNMQLKRLAENPPTPAPFDPSGIEGWDSLPYVTKKELYDQYVANQVKMFNDWNSQLPKNWQRDVNEFTQQLNTLNAGVIPQAPTKNLGTRISDIAVGFAKGAIGIPEMLVNLADVISGEKGPTSKWLGEIQKDLEDKYSDFEKNNRAILQKELDAIYNNPDNSTLGKLFSEIGVQVSNLSVAQLAELAGNILPTILLTGGASAAAQSIARGITGRGLQAASAIGQRVGIGTGAAINGAMSAGDAASTAMDEVNNMTEDQIKELPGGATLIRQYGLEKAKERLGIDAGRVAAGYAGAISVALQVAPGSMTRAASKWGTAGRPDAILTSAPLTREAIAEATETASKAATSRLGKIAESGIAKTALAGLEGGFEEAATGTAGRYGAQQVGADVDLLRGAGSEFAMGALGEGAGAGIANLGSYRADTKFRQRLENVRQDLDRRAEEFADVMQGEETAEADALQAAANVESANLSLAEQSGGTDDIDVPSADLDLVAAEQEGLDVDAIRTDRARTAVSNLGVPTSPNLSSLSAQSESVRRRQEVDASIKSVTDMLDLIQNADSMEQVKKTTEQAKANVEQGIQSVQDMFASVAEGQRLAEEGRAAREETTQAEETQAETLKRAEDEKKAVLDMIQLIADSDSLTEAKARAAQVRVDVEQGIQSVQDMFASVAEGQRLAKESAKETTKAEKEAKQQEAKRKKAAKEAVAQMSETPSEKTTALQQQVRDMPQVKGLLDAGVEVSDSDLDILTSTRPETQLRHLDGMLQSLENDLKKARQSGDYQKLADKLNAIIKRQAELRAEIEARKVEAPVSETAPVREGALSSLTGETPQETAENVRKATQQGKVRKDIQQEIGKRNPITEKSRSPVAKVISEAVVGGKPTSIEAIAEAAKRDDSVGNLAKQQLDFLRKIHKILGLPLPKIFFGDANGRAGMYDFSRNEIIISNKGLADVNDVIHEMAHSVFGYGVSRIVAMASRGNQNAANKLALLHAIQDIVNENLSETSDSGADIGFAQNIDEMLANMFNPEFLAAANQIPLDVDSLPTDMDLSSYKKGLKGDAKQAFMDLKKPNASIFQAMVDLFTNIFKMISPSKGVKTDTVAQALSLLAMDVAEESRKMVGAYSTESDFNVPRTTESMDVPQQMYKGKEIYFENGIDQDIYTYFSDESLNPNRQNENVGLLERISKITGFNEQDARSYYENTLLPAIEDTASKSKEDYIEVPVTRRMKSIMLTEAKRIEEERAKAKQEQQDEIELTGMDRDQNIFYSSSAQRRQADANANAQNISGSTAEIDASVSASGNATRSVTPAETCRMLESGVNSAPLSTVGEATMEGIKHRNFGMIKQAISAVIDKINTLFHDSMAPVKDEILSWAEDTSLSPSARRAAYDMVNTLYTARGVSENLYRRFNEEFGGNELMTNLENIARKTGLPRSQVLQDVGEYASARFVPDATDRLIKNIKKNIDRLSNQLTDPNLDEMELAEVKANLKEANKTLQKVIEDYNKDDLYAESDVLMDGMNKKQSEFIVSKLEQKYGKEVLENALKPLRTFNANKLLLDIQSGKAIPGVVAEFLERPDLLSSFNRLRQITSEEAKATVEKALVLAEEREALVNSLVKQVENNYVPMHGDLLTGETFQKVQGTGKGAVQQTKFLRREGRRTMTNGLRNSLEALASSVSYASFDPFLNHMLDAVFAMKPDQRNKYGLKVREVGGDRGRVSGDNVAVVRRGDKSYAIEFANKDFLKIIRKANVELSGEFVKQLSKPTRWFAYLCTTLNPLFAPFNQLKDTWERADQIAVRTNLRDANGKLIDGSKLTGAIWRESYNPAVMKACKKFVAGEIDNSPEGKLIRQIAKLGGISTMRGNFVESQASKYITRMRTMSGVTNAAIKKIAKAAEVWNGTQDLAPLLATYKVLMSQGMTVEQAVAATRDTMDFGKTGTGMPLIRMLYAFAQPAVTGGANMLGALYDRRTGQFNRKGVARMFTYMIGIGALQALAAAMADEDEGGNVIDQQTDYVKNTSIPFQIGDEIVKFPLGFGFPRLAASITRSLFDLSSGEIDVKDAIGKSFSHGVLSNVSPVEPTGIDPYKRPIEFMLTTLAPTWMKPMVEVGVNRSSLDAPITNRQWKKKDQFESEQFGYNVAEVYKDVAIEFRKMTGVDLSPESVRHLARGYLLGSFGIGLNMAVENPYKESRGKQTSMALFRQLYAPVTDASMKSQFYRGKDHIDGIKARLNAGEEISPIEEQLVRLGAKWDKIDEANKKDKAAITRNKMLSEATKEKRKRELSDGLEPYMADFVYQYRTILGKLARKTR